MLDTFTSAEAGYFDITWTTRQGDKAGFRAPLSSHKEVHRIGRGGGEIEFQVEGPRLAIFSVEGKRPSASAKMPPTHHFAPEMWVQSYFS